MCGIVGAIAKRNVVPVLLEGLKRLEYRGYDSAGVAVLNGKLQRLRSTGRVAELEKMAQKEGLSGDIGMLSIDIDGNDYWVWKAIDSVKPAIVVCEYNAVFGDLHRITVPYRPDFQRTRAHYSNLYFGASLPALIDLGEQKGYVFVGTNSNGCNAFFVRKDLSAVADSIGTIKSFPSAFRESRNGDGQLTFARGPERADSIRHLPVFDFGSNSVRAIADLGALYSTDWLQNN